MARVSTPSAEPVALDELCAGAVELARAALVEEIGASSVGDHLGVVADAELVVSHRFATLDKGYLGWAWNVSVARAPESDHLTVCELVLLPEDGALLPPAWLPWSERLRPGDLGVGDLLPTAADDERLAAGYMELSSDETEDLAGWMWQLGLGRPRVLGPIGRDDAADRWYDSDGGPSAPIAKAAPMPCSTCAFWLPLAGPLGQVFGACSNEWSPADRAVVTADHGCGAHSEAMVITPTDEVEPAFGGEVIDDEEIEPVVLGHEPGSVSADAAEDMGHS
jgi:Protein of unknown function (DUF3027)